MKNSKKLTAIILTGALALSVTGCGTSTAGNKEKNLLEEIKESGKLTVGMSIDYAPYEFYVMEDGAKKMVGMDIDLISEIAADLGVEYEIKEMKFSTICEAVANGIIDIGVSGLSPDEERLQLIDFSDIYFEAEQGILVSKENSATISKLSDLEGKKVGAQNGSVQAKIANTIKDAEIKLLPEVPTLIQDLVSGNLDAVIVELPVADIQAVVNPSLAVAKETINDTSGGGSAIGLPKNQPELTAAINETIKRLKDEGSIDKFYENAVKLSKDEVVGE